MQKATVYIHDEVGLHARPAARFVSLAKKFKSSLSATYQGKTVNARSLPRLLSLGIMYNTPVELTATGEDEQEAIKALVRLVEHNFTEE